MNSTVHQAEASFMEGYNHEFIYRRIEFSSSLVSLFNVLDIFITDGVRIYLRSDEMLTPQ